GAGQELGRESLFVILHYVLPAGLAHGYASANLLRVRQEFVEADDRHGELMRAAKRRCAAGTAVSSPVKAFDQITRLLKFNRKEISCRDIYPLEVEALLVCATRSDLVRPEIPSTLVRFTAEEVEILLTDVEPRVRIVQRVRG